MDTGLSSLNGEHKPLGSGKYVAPTVAFVLSLVLRALYSAFAALSVPHLLLLPALIRANLFTENVMTPANRLAYSLFGVWQRFDTLNYVHIAQFGYDAPILVVFYPLYPLLIRVLTPLFKDSLATALAISFVATFFLFWGLLLLVRLDFGDRVATRAVIFYAVWPASFIFFCGYAESGIGSDRLEHLLCENRQMVASRNTWRPGSVSQSGWNAGCPRLGYIGHTRAAMAKPMGGVAARRIGCLPALAAFHGTLNAMGCLPPLLAHSDVVALDSCFSHGTQRLPFA
jgi:hypothetical protein